jgi:hypothetical protein
MRKSALAEDATAEFSSRAEKSQPFEPGLDLVGGQPVILE